MKLMHLSTYSVILFYLLIAKSMARPLNDLNTFISTTDDTEGHFNNDYFTNYQTRPVAPKGSLLNHLNRGYYYINDGQITPVNPTYFGQNVKAGRRRQDRGDAYNSNEKKEDGVKYTPLLRYNESHAKRKMLFVPNFFG